MSCTRTKSIQVEEHSFQVSYRVYGASRVQIDDLQLKTALGYLPVDVDVLRTQRSHWGFQQNILDLIEIKLLQMEFPHAKHYWNRRFAAALKALLMI